MKKTYIIKDQGKGLVENLTPDKLFDIANGGSSGNVVLSDYIPLTGTEEGKPVTRPIELKTTDEDNNAPVGFKSSYSPYNGVLLKQSFGFQDSSNYMKYEWEFTNTYEPSFDYYKSIQVNPDKGFYFDWEVENPNDYTLVQKIYVDKKDSYSIDEEQVGYFTYLNGNGVKVRKPKYRRAFQSTLRAKENPMTANWIVNGFDIISLDEPIQNIINASADFTMYGMRLGFGVTSTSFTFLHPVRLVKNIINIGYFLSDTLDQIYIDGFITIIDESLPNPTTISLPNDSPYTLYLEYTKTTDSETLID